MKTKVWLVHDGTIEGVMAGFFDETRANQLCDDLNSSSNDNSVYYVDRVDIEGSHGVVR